MPRQLHSSEQFQKILPKAVELRVVRGREYVKLKLRTPDYLYTYRTNEDEAEDILKNAKEIEVIEITSSAEKKEERKKKEEEK
jgi:hypothetical protein